MISPHYRIFASNQIYLKKFTQLIMFVLKFARNTNMRGGRGAFFLTLVTESIVRHTQLCISKVIRKFLETTRNSEKDPNELVIKNILKENQYFSMSSFYRAATYNPLVDGGILMEDIQEVTMEESPWHWWSDFVSDHKILDEDKNNLMTEDWFIQAYEIGSKTFPTFPFQSAWKDNKLTKHAPSKVAHFIREGLKPQARTCYLLLAIYKEMGFTIPLFHSDYFVHDIIGTRLEAFCRMFLGTVFHKYFVVNKTTGRYKYRTEIDKQLENYHKGIIFHRGNHFSSRWSPRENSETDKTGKL